jgi:hypothetical protein
MADPFDVPQTVQEPIDYEQPFTVTVRRETATAESVRDETAEDVTASDETVSAETVSSETSEDVTSSDATAAQEPEQQQQDDKVANVFASLMRGAVSCLLRSSLRRAKP